MYDLKKMEDEKSEMEPAIIAQIRFGKEELQKFDPQLFINDTLNAVEDRIQEGFDFFETQAKRILAVKDPEKSKKLTKAVNDLRHSVQKAVDKKLNIWENICHVRCFQIPKELDLSKQDKSTKKGSWDKSSDGELEAKLDSLRENIKTKTEETIALQQELLALKRQAATKKYVEESVVEALCPLEQDGTCKILKVFITNSQCLASSHITPNFQAMLCLEGSDLTKVAPELKDKTVNLISERRKTSELTLMKAKNPVIDGNMVELDSSLEDLQQIAKRLRGGDP